MYLEQKKNPTQNSWTLEILFSKDYYPTNNEGVGGEGEQSRKVIIKMDHVYRKSPSSDLVNKIY